MDTLLNSQRVGRTIGCAVVTMAILLGGVTPAHAGVGDPACLAKKLKEWGKLRKCEAGEKAKALQAKPFDVAKCQTKFDTKLAKLNVLASATTVACRYGVNTGPEAGTVTDYDTGLQWEQKTDDGTVHDMDNTATWCVGVGPNCTNPANAPNGTAFTGFLGTLNNGTSGDGVTTSGCFAGHCDWRLPAIEELAGIVDPGIPGCGSGSPCIDQTAFGPMSFREYWSASTYFFPDRAWIVQFVDGSPAYIGKRQGVVVRAVRSGLVGELPSTNLAAGFFPEQAACLGKKLKEWGKLRSCQATENAKALQGKPADPAKCQTKLEATLLLIGNKFAATPPYYWPGYCQYGTNGDGTLIDYDTGRQWELKTSLDGVQNPSDPHDADNSYSWTATASGTTPDGTAFTDFLGTLNNGKSVDGAATFGCFAGHCDWRLPAIEELMGIVLPTACQLGACVDPAFLPMREDSYWSATTAPTGSYEGNAWTLASDGTSDEVYKSAVPVYVRAVRSGS